MSKSEFRAYMLKFRSILMGVGSLAMAYGAYWLTTIDLTNSGRRRNRLISEFLSENPEVLWAFAALFVIIAIHWFSTAFMSKPVVAIDDKGVIFHLLSDQKIPFSNIKTAKLKKIQRITFLEFELLDKKTYTLKTFQKIMHFMGLRKSYRAMVSHLDKDPDEIWGVFMNRMRPQSSEDGQISAFDESLKL